MGLPQRGRRSGVGHQTAGGLEHHDLVVAHLLGVVERVPQVKGRAVLTGVVLLHSQTSLLGLEGDAHEGHRTSVHSR